MIYELSLVYSDNAKLSGDFKSLTSLANIHNLAIEYSVTPDEIRDFSAVDYEFAIINSEAKSMAQKRVEMKQKMKAQSRRAR
jgi:hypothetical protein